MALERQTTLSLVNMPFIVVVPVMRMPPYYAEIMTLPTHYRSANLPFMSVRQVELLARHLK